MEARKEAVVFHNVLRSLVFVKGIISAAEADLVIESLGSAQPKGQLMSRVCTQTKQTSGAEAQNLTVCCAAWLKPCPSESKRHKRQQVAASALMA